MRIQPIIEGLSLPDLKPKAYEQVVYPEKLLIVDLKDLYLLRPSN
jgi:hypothetical protein